jgi:hypothetical protein
LFSFGGTSASASNKRDSADSATSEREVVNGLRDLFDEIDSVKRALLKISD